MPRALAREMAVPSGALIKGGKEALSVFEAVADAARMRAKKARGMAENIPKEARAALWPLRGADIYLARLKKAGGDPFDERLQHGMRATYPLRLQIALLRCRITGRL